MDQVFGVSEQPTDGTADVNAAPQDDMFADPLESTDAPVDDTNPADDAGNSEAPTAEGEASTTDNAAVEEPTTEETPAETTTDEG